VLGKDIPELFGLTTGFPIWNKIGLRNPPSAIHFSALSNKIGKGNFGIWKTVGV